MAFSFRRIFIRFAIGIIALSCILIITTRLQQYRVRFCASQLSSDLELLEVGKATLDQVRPLLQKWNAAYEGQCTADRCDAVIEIRDFGWAHADWAYWYSIPVYRCFGGRPSKIFAEVGIENGVVNRKALTLIVEVFPDENERASAGYNLIAKTSFTPGLADMDEDAPSHPYKIGRPTGCLGCVSIYTRLTPFASQADVKKLSQINFSCLTRWLSPCRSRQDIMPAAWAEKHSTDPSW
ncbi:MAG: hypothetical protein ABSE92_14750 [Terriglobales bacterium]